MKTLILAVILAVMQASPPIPRNATNSSTKTSGNAKSGTADEHDRSSKTNMPVETTKNRQGDQNFPNQEGHPNAQQSMRIAELPSVSIKRDWAEWILWGASVSLALIGIVGAFVALRTLRAIQRQTAAIIESQKPRLSVKAHGNPTQTLSDHDAPRVLLELHNLGLTPAHDLIYESWIELSPLPFVDFTPSADHFRCPEQMMLYPHQDPMIINVPLRNGVTPEQLSGLRHLQIFACVRIRVEYRDAFSPRRWAEFGYMVHADGLGFLPKYNGSN